MAQVNPNATTKVAKTERKKRCPYAGHLVLRISTIFFILVSAACVVLGRPICSQISVSGRVDTRTEFRCDGGNYSPVGWRNGALRGQFFAMGNHICLLVLTIVLLFLRCCSPQHPRPSEFFILSLCTLSCVVNAGLEAFLAFGLGHVDRNQQTQSSARLWLIVISYAISAFLSAATAFFLVLDAILMALKTRQLRRSRREEKRIVVFTSV